MIVYVYKYLYYIVACLYYLELCSIRHDVINMTMIG